MKERHKLNKQRMYLLLSLFLCIGCLTAATGTAFARYQSEQEEKLLFEVRRPETIMLGTIQGNEFIPLNASQNLEWVIDQETKIASLTFAVANGTDKENYSLKDQEVKLRMYGSLSLAEEGMPPELSVTYIDKKLNGDEEERVVQGEISYLVEGTVLYHTYGPGFIYTFYENEENKEELSWTLSGGELSCINLKIQTTGAVSGVLGPLQPLITAEPMGN